MELEDFPSQEKNEYCPKCCQNFSSILKAMDGGSDICSRCGCVFHKCADGTYKFGSPGPSLCEICQNPNNNIQLNQID